VPPYLQLAVQATWRFDLCQMAHSLKTNKTTELFVRISLPPPNNCCSHFYICRVSLCKWHDALICVTWLIQQNKIQNNENNRSLLLNLTSSPTELLLWMLVKPEKPARKRTWEKETERKKKKMGGGWGGGRYLECIDDIQYAEESTW